MPPAVWPSASSSTSPPNSKIKTANHPIGGFSYVGNAVLRETRGRVSCLYIFPFVGALIKRPPNHLYANDWDFAEINWMIAWRRCDFAVAKPPGG